MSLIRNDVGYSNQVSQCCFRSVVLGYVLRTQMMNWHQAVEIMSPQIAPLIFGPMGPTTQLFSFSGNVEALINGLYF